MNLAWQSRYETYLRMKSVCWVGNLVYQTNLLAEIFFPGPAKPMEIVEHEIFLITRLSRSIPN